MGILLCVLYKSLIFKKKKVTKFVNLLFCGLVAWNCYCLLFLYAVFCKTLYKCSCLTFLTTLHAVLWRQPSHVFSSEYLETSKVRKFWTFNPFYPELSGMLVTFYTVILGFFGGCFWFGIFFPSVSSELFLFFEIPSHPKKLLSLFPIPFLFSFFISPAFLFSSASLV